MRNDASRTLRRVIAVCLALVAASLAQPSGAQVVIRLGTIAPEGSVWHDALLKMRQAWRERSGGRVELRIYAGGVLGSEDELVRKLQRRVIDAVTLSAGGLPMIDNGFNCLNLPMLFDEPEELDFIRNGLAPKIEARVEKKGFRVLNWAIAGTVHFFAREPVRVPDDLRRQRLWMSTGYSEWESLYKDFGLRTVPLPVTEMLTGLQTGLIDAIPAPPLFVLLDRSYQVANHMTDFSWAALVAATVVSAQAWQKVPPDLRAPLTAAAQEIGSALRDAARKAGDDAVREMQARGLQLVATTEAQRAQWRAEAEKAYPPLRNTFCPGDLYDEAIRLNRAYEEQQRNQATRR